LRPRNVDKRMKVPCCVIVAHDSRFHQFMPGSSPHATSRRRSYVIRAQRTRRQRGIRRCRTLTSSSRPRTLGLDAGPMSGFD
jgi:3-hydroxypropanoate dehydrogenase